MANQTPSHFRHSVIKHDMSRTFNLTACSGIYLKTRASYKVLDRVLGSYLSLHSQEELQRG